MTDQQKEFLALYESVLKALESFNKLRDKKTFLSFMFTIAKNIVNNKHRRLKFQGKYNEEDVYNIPDNGIDVETRHDVEILYQMLKNKRKLQLLT